MSNKVVRLGCEYFDFKGNKAFNERPVYTKRLGDVYKTCSQKKISSWNRWVLFFENDDIIQTETYGIIGASTWQYSIGAVVYSPEHDEYYLLKITANNKYAWQLI